MREIIARRKDCWMWWLPSYSLPPRKAIIVLAVAFPYPKEIYEISEHFVVVTFKFAEPLTDEQGVSQQSGTKGSTEGGMKSGTIGGTQCKIIVFLDNRVIFFLLCRSFWAFIPPSPCPLFLFFLLSQKFFSPFVSSLRSERSAPKETVLIFASLRTICSRGDCAYLRFAPNDLLQRRLCIPRGNSGTRIFE